MPRNRVEWKIRNEVWRLGERTLLCGVIDAAPDPADPASPSLLDPDRAFVRAVEFSDQGVDMIEIAPERIRQGLPLIAEAEELRRVVPILKRLKGKLAVPVAVQTWKPAVAEKAIEHGALIIRDPSGLTLDQDLARVVVQHDVGFVLQHMRGTPDKWAKLGAWKNPITLVAAELTAALNRANRLGVDRARLAVDPGFGMGKRKESNTEILIALDQLQRFRLPVMVSPSGQQFDAETRVEPSTATSIAAATMAVLRGAHIVRTHQPEALRPALLITDQALRTA